MKHILVGILSIAFLVLDVHAQREFRFHVSNHQQDDEMNFERIQQFEIGSNDDGTADAFFQEYFYVYGIKRAEFTYQPYRYQTQLPAKAYQDFLQAVAKLDPKQLEKETKGSKLFVWGELNINEKQYRIRVAPDSPERKGWEEIFMDLHKRFPPAASDRQEQVVLQGDFFAPIKVCFADLLKTPNEYSGKRVRVLGHYHGEFEGSHFSRTKEKEPDYEHAFWLGGHSVFVDSEKFPKINDTFIVVDATFEPQSHGHMGLWMAELSRVTALRKATKKEVEQAGADQPATKPADKPPVKDQPSTPTSKDRPR